MCVQNLTLLYPVSPIANFLIYSVKNRSVEEAIYNWEM